VNIHVIESNSTSKILINLIKIRKKLEYITKTILSQGNCEGINVT
jgi:hypothetical protein